MKPTGVSWGHGVIVFSVGISFPTSAVGNLNKLACQQSKNNIIYLLLWQLSASGQLTLATTNMSCVDR